LVLIPVNIEYLVLVLHILF